ncbi:unnamed protein product [Peniophora sp. CBMAI 1063]|nr:unnamed protein product [Peniophora sp. CBMAI 1063]
MASASRVTVALQERTSLYSSLARQKRPEALNEYLMDIELELWDIDTAVAVLRRQRNALIPISSLPPELLSLIFRHLADIQPHYVQHHLEYDAILSKEYERDLRWIKVTQVCHAWREDVFADGQLWIAATTLYGKDWFECMIHLGRYQPEQMDIIHGQFLWPNPPTLLSACSEPFRTVSRLRIIGREHGIFESASLALPDLKSLHVHLDSTERPYELSDALFEGAPSQLRDLYLHNMTVRLDASFISSLTHLSLSMWSRGPGNKIYYQELVDALNLLSCLKSFTMQSYSFEFLGDDTTTVADAKDIVYPQLAYVNVYASGQSDLTLLLMSKLRPAPEARMVFATILPDFNMSPHGPLILENLQRCMLDSNVSPLRGMQTTEWRARAPRAWRDLPIGEGPGAPCFGHSAILSAWRNNRSDVLLRDYDDYCDRPLPPPNFQLILGVRTGSRPLQLDGFIPFAAFRDARCFSVRPVHRASLDVSFDNGWNELFRAAPTLAWLRADRQVGENLVLNANIAHQYSTHKRLDPFPANLRTLAMLGIRWDYDWGGVSELPVHRILNEIGSLTNIGEVIVGNDTYEGRGLQVEWSNAIMSVVRRPEWFNDDHSDWDGLADM